jgi:hypothetical protein
MISASQAILLAYEQAYLPRRFRVEVGNIAAIPEPGCYRVELISLPETARTTMNLATTTVIVDSNTGKILSARSSPTKQSPYSKLETAARSISGVKALEAALLAIRGYEHYDKMGKLTIELKGDHFHVTFPAQSRSNSVRGPDYAYLIWVNAKTAKVEKILVPS